MLQITVRGTMWVPKTVVDWFHISRDAVNSLREELAIVKTERDILKQQLSVSQIHFDWLRLKVNTLEMERTALMEKAFNIKLPAPEIVRTPVIGSEQSMDEFTFDDIGETLAKQFGLPAHAVKQ